jgi:hypothetical protein
VGWAAGDEAPLSFLPYDGSRIELRNSGKQTATADFFKVTRLHAAGLYYSQPVVNSLMRESTHVVLSLRTGCETTPAGELGVRSVFKIDVTFPRPRACPGVLVNYSTKGLFTVEFTYLVTCLFCTVSFHD